MSGFHCENCLFISCLHLPKPCTDTEYCLSDGFLVDCSSGELQTGTAGEVFGIASEITGDIPRETEGEDGYIRQHNPQAAPGQQGQTKQEKGSNSSDGLHQSIDRCEEEIVVLTTLKQTAEVCLAGMLTKEVSSKEAPARRSELSVRVYEALAQESGPTEGQDVYVKLRYAGKEFTTTRKPSRPWATGTGGTAGSLGALHVTWNELYNFQAESYLDHPGCLYICIEREDGQELGSAEMTLESLLDQRVHHQWCTIGSSWRVYVACQYMRSPVDMLQSHIREFEVRLQAADATLSWMRSSLAENEMPASPETSRQHQEPPVNSIMAGDGTASKETEV